MKVPFLACYYIYNKQVRISSRPNSSLLFRQKILELDQQQYFTWVYVYFGCDYKVICPIYLGCPLEVITYLRRKVFLTKNKVPRTAHLHQGKYVTDYSLLEIINISELLPVLTLKYNNKYKVAKYLTIHGF